MKYRCPKCNNTFDGKAKFCPNCGQPLYYLPKQDNTSAVEIDKPIISNTDIEVSKTKIRMNSKNVSYDCSFDENGLYRKCVAKRHHKMMVFDIVLCLVILMLSIIAILADYFSELIGKLVVITGSLPLSNAKYLGKIIALGWLVVTPHFLFTMSDHAFELQISKIDSSNTCKIDKLETTKEVFFWIFLILGIVSLVGIIVGFFWSGSYFACLEKNNDNNFFERFISNFQRINVWYITPLFNLILCGYLRFSRNKLEYHPITYMVLGSIVSIILMLGLPILFLWLGGLVALIISVLIVVFGFIMTLNIVSSLTADGHICANGDIHIYK